MVSGNQTEQHVENYIRIVVANVKNDECTTAGKDVQCEVQPAEVAFRKKGTY